MKNNNLWPIILRISVAILLTCGILILTSFKRAGPSENDILEEEDPKPNLSSYTINNPLVNRSNAFGGEKNDILLNVFSNSSSFYLITKAASTNTNYCKGSPGLYLLKLDKNGNFQSKLFLGNTQYFDSEMTNETIIILLENKLLTIDKNLNITEEECIFNTMFKKDNILFFFSNLGSFCFNNNTYNINYKDFKVLDIDCIKNILFIYKNNCLYLVDYINNKTVFSFYDISNPQIIIEEDGYVFSAIVEGGLVITKLNLSGEVVYSCFCEDEVQNYSITKYFYGYLVITQTIDGLTDFMLCKHLDLISSSSISLPNAKTLLTTKLIDDTLYVTYITSSENLKFIKFIGQSTTFAILNGIGVNSKVIQSENCLFIESFSSSYDFDKNSGNSDIFFFSFNYL